MSLTTLIAEYDAAAARYYALVHPAEEKGPRPHMTVDEELDIQFAREDAQAAYKAMRIATPRARG